MVIAPGRQDGGSFIFRFYTSMSGEASALPLSAVLSTRVCQYVLDILRKSMGTVDEVDRKL